MRKSDRLKKQREIAAAVREAIVHSIAPLHLAANLLSPTSTCRDTISRNSRTPSTIIHLTHQAHKIIVNQIIMKITVQTNHPPLRETEWL